MTSAAAARPADLALRRVVATYIKRRAKPGIVCWEGSGSRLCFAIGGKVLVADLRAGVAPRSAARGVSLTVGIDAALAKLATWGVVEPAGRGP